MGVMDRIDQQEQEQSFSEMCASVEQLHSGQEEILRVFAQLIESQNSLTSTMEQVSTSVTSAASSNAGDGSMKLGGVKRRLEQLEEGVKALTESLANSETVRLADGTSLKSSDVEAHTLTKQIVGQITGLRSEQAKLAAQVRAKGTLKVDDEKLAGILMAKLEPTMNQKIAESAQRVEKLLRAQERRLEDVGGKVGSKVAEELNEASSGLRRAETTASQLKGALTWAGIGRVAMAALPVALALLAVALLVGAGGQLFGVGPVFGWAWESFEAAQAGWQKALIAIATIGGAGGVLVGVGLLGKKLAEAYRGW